MRLPTRKALTYTKYALVAVFAFVLFSQVSSAEVLAQVDTGQYMPQNPTGNDDLIEWVKLVLNIVIGIAALIAVAILVYSGIMYITSAGDEGKVSKATKGITYAIIGLIIAFISVLIVNFVLGTILMRGS